MANSIVKSNQSIPGSQSYRTSPATKIDKKKLLKDIILTEITKGYFFDWNYFNKFRAI